jgi:hypothetical protein
VLKSQVVLNELKPNSTDIICSLIAKKYLNRHSQYEPLSLSKFNSLYNIQKNKILKHCKPKIIKFVNYDKYKNIEN